MADTNAIQMEVYHKVCKKCGGKFENYYDLKPHMKDDHDAYLCDETHCDEYFTNDEMQEHKGEKHSKQQCKNLNCKQHFKKREKLEEHCQKCHKKCDKCGLTIGNLDELDQHMDQEHESKRCPETGCDDEEIYYGAEDLRKHLIDSHKKQKCIIGGCEDLKCFDQEEKYYFHMVKKHGEVKCFCRRKFTNEMDFCRHLKDDHEIFMCHFCGVIFKSQVKQQTHERSHKNVTIVYY